MPEGRMLKKVISESKKLGTLPSDSARLLYTWLIPWLDIEGRHSADPEIIKGHVFPKVKSMTTRKIERLVHELNEGRLIILYVCDGETYLQFKKTLQKIDPTREAKSTILDPKKGRIIKPTHENSGVAQENSSISKVNESKVKEKTSCSENPSEHAFKYSETHKNLAKLLETKIKERIPRHKFTGKHYLEEWANEFRIMEEKEEATPEEIEKLIVWVSKNDFWYKNIRSAEKLRRQFGRLWAEMEDEAKKGGKRDETSKEFTARTKEALKAR